MKAPWPPSVWISARRWPARARLSPSPSPSAQPSTGSQDTPAPPAKAVKNKKSPSTQRRDARRRKEFLKNKSEIPVSTLVKPVGDSTDVTLAGQDVQ